MRLLDYGSLSDEELRELAKKKYKKSGLFTKSAIRAQRELWRRNHWFVSDRADDERDLLDVQYNG